MLDGGGSSSSTSPASESYEVVHDQVAIRAAPSVKAKMLGALRRGHVVQGKRSQIEGRPWLELDGGSRRDLFLQKGAAWMLIDGHDVGLGQLLKRADTSDNSKVQLVDILSRSQRVALQEACVAKYRVQDFQRELHATWARWEGNARRQLEARAALCAKVHSLICRSLFKKPQASSSVHLLLDVFHAHACFREQDKPSKTETELSSWLMWLLNPYAQASHPRGLPPQIDVSAAAALAEMSGTVACDGPPRQRVLARIPVALESSDSSNIEDTLNVQVRSALTGDVLCKFSTEKSDTVSFLKRKITSLAGIDVAQQKLIYGWHILKDWETLHSILTIRESLKFSEPEKNYSDDKLDLLLMRVEAARADCLRRLESGTLNLWDLESYDSEDPEYALASVRGNGLGLKFVPEALHSNVDFILEAVRLQGDALKYASKELRATPEVVLTAVQQDGSALRHAGASLRNERSIVLEAVEKDGLALNFASDELKANPEVALAAVEQSGMALQYVDPSVANIRDVAITALQQNKQASDFVGRSLRQDFTFFAALEELGMFEDTILETLLWIESKQANMLLQRGLAIFIDARDWRDFRVSRVRSASSLPYNVELAYVSSMPAWKLIGEQPSKIVIVYGDTGRENSYCANVARRLRNRDDVKTHRVLRLTGGLNHWKRGDFDVEGDSREMIDGIAIAPSGDFTQEGVAATVLKAMVMEQQGRKE